MYIICMDVSHVQTKTDLPADTTTLRDFTWNLVLHYQKLQERIALLLRQRFGQSSEKLVGVDAEQLELAGLLAELFEAPAKDEESIEILTIEKHTRRRKHPGRNVIPDTIETEKVLHDIPEEEKICDCCCKPKTVITVKTHTVIERIPAQYKAFLHIRPVYACSTCKLAISVSEPPVLPIPKGLVGPNLLCFVIISKYQFHLPLYRIQRQIFHESRIWFTRSTMVSWLRYLFVGIQRIHKELISIYTSSRIKHADETHLDVRYQDLKGKHHEGRLWAGIGKENQDDAPVAVFHYAKHRSSQAAIEFLKGSSPGDILMVDGCESYTRAVIGYGLIELNCMAHARRKFDEALTTGYKKAYALLILRKIAQLYRIERWATIANVSDAKRGELRKRFSSNILADIKRHLDEPGFHVLPTRKIGIAIQYMKNHWIYLIRFLENGSYPIDNNILERIIRALAIGRNNWGNAGSEAGAHWIAAWFSIIATCLLNNINPQEYILDVIQRLPLRTGDMSVKDLTPIQWIKSLPSKNDNKIQYPKN